VRGADDVIYAGELGEETTLTYTRQAPEGWTGHTGRIDAELVAEAAAGARIAFACGSNPFVETASALLMEAGLAAVEIRTERFGPTGSMA
jgi:ferredoxin-NADP reductase